MIELKTITNNTNVIRVLVQSRLNLQNERLQTLISAKSQMKKRPYNKLRKQTIKDMRATSKATRNFVKAAKIIAKLQAASQ